MNLNNDRVLIEIQLSVIIGLLIVILESMK